MFTAGSSSGLQGADVQRPPAARADGRQRLRGGRPRFPRRGQPDFEERRFFLGQYGHFQRRWDVLQLVALMNTEVTFKTPVLNLQLPHETFKSTDTT